jgi:hypothetical protein
MRSGVKSALTSTSGNSETETEKDSGGRTLLLSGQSRIEQRR